MKGSLVKAPVMSEEYPGVPTPRIASAVITRTHLMKRLNQMAPVIILEGITGSGRTTLAVQWITQFVAPWKRIWIDGKTVSTMQSLTKVVTLLRGQLTAERAVIVIDDFELPFDQETIELIDNLVNKCPGLHLMLCASATNSADKWRKWGRAECQILTQHDLNADREELSYFLESWGHASDINTLKELHEVFQGWLGPTRYALDSNDTTQEDIRFPKTRGQVHQILVNQSGNHNFRFVAYTMAITDVVTEDLLRLLLQHNKVGREILSCHLLPDLLSAMEDRGIIEKSTVFTHIDAWRVAPPILAVLRDSANREPDATEKHRHIVRYWTASAYKQAAIPLLITHARAGRDWNKLEALWRQNGTKIFAHEKEAINAYRQLPLSVGKQHPWLLAISKLVTALSQPEISLKGSLVTEGQDIDRDSVIASGRMQDPNIDLVSATEAIAEMRRSGNVAAALEVALTKYHAYLKVVGKYNTAEGFAFLAWFELEWALAAASDQRKTMAFSLFKRSLEHAKLSHLDFLITFVAARLAMHAQVVGYTRDSDKLTNFLLQESKSVELPGIQPIFVLTEAMRRLAQFDGSGVEEQLKRLEGMGERFELWSLVILTKTQHALLFGDPGAVLTQIKHAYTTFTDQVQFSNRNRTVITRCTADLLMSLGELHRARKLVEGPEGSTPEMMVPKSRVALLSDQPNVARAIAREGIWGGQPTTRDQVELLLIEATASLSVADHESAATAYLRAKAAANELGTRIPLMMFSDKTLRELAENAGDADVAFLTRPPNVKEVVYPSQDIVVSLTPKEYEVLVEMTQGRPLSQIANKLSISPNTIKKHSISIYNKLGVHSRADAINIAGRLGLIGHI